MNKPLEIIVKDTSCIPNFKTIDFFDTKFDHLSYSKNYTNITFFIVAQFINKSSSIIMHNWMRVILTKTDAYLCLQKFLITCTRAWVHDLLHGNLNTNKIQINKI